MPQPTDGMMPQHCLAQAIYDNAPDSPDELAFRKGDTLIVLEQNTGNLQGWWLCSLHGRQGICPGNRLRLIPGVYTDSDHRVHSPHFSEISGEFNSQTQGKRKSWHAQPNQVVCSKKCTDVYDMPPRFSPCPVAGLSPREQTINDCYDVPPSRTLPVDENFRHHSSSRYSPAPSCISPISRSSCDAYDTPRSLILQANPLTPSSSASSLTADSLSSSNRSSLANGPDYDIPRPATRVPIHLQHHHHHQQQHHQNYDIPATVKELPLALKSALENLERFENDATSSISKLLGFVGPQWRTKERLENNMMDIKLAATRLRTALHDLAEFGDGTLGNASKASDKNLAGKLSPLVMALKRSDKLVSQAIEKLDEVRWSVEVLSRTDDDEKNRKPDELEQLVACSRVLTEDVRQIASFIQGNGTLLFKKEPPTNNNNGWMEEYDYVSLDSKDAVSKRHEEIREALPSDLKKGFDNLVKHADDVAFDADNNGTNKSGGLDSDDKHVLNFYGSQFITHHKYLSEAIDAFFQTVERNQPPKIFLAHGKFIVLSAHKLIHIGDTVHRNVSCKEIKDRALSCANALSDALANSVNKTKQAALQFPSVNAVQEMINSIVDISYSARDLKACLLQAANPM